jgi:uncharacterized protein YxeA
MRPLKPQSSAAVGGRGVGHETRDISIGGVVTFLIALGTIMIVLAAILLGVFKLSNQYADKQNEELAKQNPWIKAELDRDAKAQTQWKQELEKRGMELNAYNSEARASVARVQRFAQPRLQSDDVYDMERLREAEDKQLTGLFYTDKNAGRVNLPIEQAMQLVVQRGLPSQAARPGDPVPQIPESTGVSKPSIESTHAVERGESMRQR